VLDALVQAAGSQRAVLAAGVYAAVTGPCYETPAEIRALRTCGADAVGMSTAREIQTGNELGMACGAVSCITNRAAGLANEAIQHEEVLSTAEAASERLGKLLDGFVQVVARCGVNCL
jgi:purine-nucleoside phosphorylase